MKNFTKRMLATVCMGIMLVTASGCGNDKTINGKTYETYGFINKEDVKDPSVKYKTITGNVIWSVLTFSTVVGPIYFLGFSLYEPVEKIATPTPTK